MQTNQITSEEFYGAEAADRQAADEYKADCDRTFKNGVALFNSCNSPRELRDRTAFYAPAFSELPNFVLRVLRAYYMERRGVLLARAAQQTAACNSGRARA